jgi:NADPH2:quinone reductase
MKALRIHGFDGLHQWQLEEMPRPVPGPGQVLVRVVANAISFVDLLFARGGYQVKPPLPLVPGTEFSGVLVECGADVDTKRLQPGRSVIGTVVGGAWAEFVCASAADVELLPEGLDMVSASALPITGATALYALRRRGNLQSGETVLVLGAGGGVGLACVRVAKALGARVIAGESTPSKCELARSDGADAAVDTTEVNWRANLKSAAPDGVDVVVDPVGGELTETAFRTLRWGGRYLMIGFAGGNIGTLKTNLPLLKGAAMIGVDVRQFREREPQAAQQNLVEVVGLFARGDLRPRIAGVYPIADWQAAIAAATDRGTQGRAVLRWGQAGPRHDLPRSAGPVASR